MDFLEMDFDPGESEDEEASNVTDRHQQQQEDRCRPQTDEEREPQAAEIHLLDVAAGGVETHDDPILVTTMTSDQNDVNLAAAAIAMLPNDVDDLASQPSNYQSEISDNFDGIYSAPLQSPAEHPVDNFMVRSQSLNSPLARQQFLSRLEPSMVRGESDPGTMLMGGARNKRRHSGEGGILCNSSSSSSGLT